MSGLFDILPKIKARPGLYLGMPSVSNLFVFLAGYKTARRELKIETTEEENEFYGQFQSWLQKRLQVTTVKSWADIIELKAAEEPKAFYYFFDLLDEFRNRDKNLDGDWFEERARKAKLKIGV